MKNITRALTVQQQHRFFNQLDRNQQELLYKKYIQIQSLEIYSANIFGKFNNDFEQAVISEIIQTNSQNIAALWKFIIGKIG